MAETNTSPEAPPTALPPTEPAAARVDLYRVPLAAPAAAIAGGIVLGRYLNLPVGLYAAIGVAAIVAAVVLARRQHLHVAAVAAAVIAVAAGGAVHLHMAAFQIADDHVVTYVGDSPILATVVGTVATAPQTYEQNVQTGYRSPPRTSFLLRTSGIRTSAGLQPSSGLLRVTVREADERLLAGQQVELCGTLGRFRGADNPGQFDWAAAAAANGTLAWFSVPAPDGVTLLSQPGVVGRVFWNLRAAARQHLSWCGDAGEAHLLNALIVGERHPSLRSLNRAMVRAGVAHYLSISGMHLGIFLGFIYMLCRLATLAPGRAAGVVLAVLTVYLLLAEPNVPLLRSSIMAAAFCLATMSGRRHVSLNSLAAAGIVLLALDPMHLFSAGFQLSFVIVAALIVLRRPMQSLLFGRWMWRRGLMVFRNDQRLRRWLYFSGANAAMSFVSMSVTAYVAAAPIVAYHFGLFSPYALLLTVLALPLVVAVLIPGYLSMALAWPMPNLSHALGSAAAGAADALEGAVAAMQSLPLLHVELRPVSMAWALLFYAVLATILYWRRLGRAKWAAVVSVPALLAMTWYTQRPAPPPPAAQLHVLSVGAGQCLLLHTSDGRTWLIDAGTRSGFDAYDQVLAPFLRHMRLPSPTAAFVSHGNTDHYNALPQLVRDSGLPAIYLNDYLGRTASVPASEAELLDLCESRRIRQVRLRAGDKVQFDERTNVEVLWPPADAPDDLNVNDTSLVLRIVCDGRSILVPGDIEERAQAELVTHDQIDCDVLILPHHGAWKPTLPAFVEAARPELVVTSNAYQHHPTAGDTAQAYFYDSLPRKYRCYSTWRDGWINVTLGESLNVQKMR